MIREFEITCPGCEGWIVVDLESGEVLRHGKKKESRQKKPVDPRKFDEAMTQLRHRDASGDSLFDEAIRGVEEQKKRLEAAFEEARRKAQQNPDERPPNPFDRE